VNAALVEAFTLGLLTAGSACLLPLYPAFVAYLAGDIDGRAPQRVVARGGAAVLAGVLSAMLLAGVLVTLAAISLGSVLEILIPLADVVLVALGLALLVGRNPFMRLPGVAAPRVTNRLGQAYVYGLLLGPIALPCSGAFLVALLATALDPVEVGVRLGTFVAYGIGFGAPLVILSLVSAARGQALARLIARHHRTLDVVGGLVLVTLGIVELLRVISPTLLGE
jgi:cytochrome c-type biogenesis protein